LIQGWDHKGYQRIEIKRKTYLLHRSVAFAFLDLDINDTSKFIDHINRNTQDNKIENLRVVSNQQNQFNRCAKGYNFESRLGKYRSYIYINRQRINLGCFENELDARNAYLEAKAKYHII
jgi:hypothetical protein